MLRIAARPITRVVVRHTHQNKNGRVMNMSTASKNVLEGDAGALSTHVYHKVTTFMAVATPLYFMVPDSMTDGVVNQGFGIVLASNIAMHSWIGLNYVATDYVPKVSKALVGPARIVNAGMGVITLFGLSAMALSPGGIKGTLKALWNPKIAKEETKN
mmetsp:Transcript_12329/g.17202  ORF Transcript_12329/g.17202 Transcript_12329/m.17202 type:complete len:158 (-) Transcript_12329:253-726(-)